MLHAPVIPTGTGIVWENYRHIVELNICVVTDVIVPQPQEKINVITVHNVEKKCAHFSYVTIAGQPVKMKQDTGAEVNVMSKYVFDKLSKTSVLKVKHNDVMTDVLFFTTNVDDTKVILD